MSSRRALNILGIGGSLRKASNTAGILRYAKANAPKHINFTISSSLDLPNYNGDFDNQKPEGVKKLSAEIAAADALYFALPEYNYSIPGFLKNAIDWVSRVSPSPFDGKPVAIASSGGYVAGLRSYRAMRDTAQFLNLHVLNKPEVHIRMFEQPQKFDAKGDLIDATSQQMVLKQLEALYEFSLKHVKSN